MENESCVEESKKEEPVPFEEKSNKDGSTDNNQSAEDVDAIKKKATLLFLQGKRSIFIRDYPAAVATLSEACQLFCQIYPDQDEALADPYFYCGKALLEVGRNESEVLGDQMQKENDEEDDDEDEEDEEADENGEKSEADGNNDKATSSENGVTEKSEDNKGELEDNKNGEENDENGEINDLQLSWEYLELAKLIYLKKSDTCTETAVKLAETYLCLGENGLESENYSIAIEDISRALELQIKHLKPEDRRIAETYYQLGVAHSLNQNYDEAINSFNKAIEQLGKKIASLEMRKKMGDKKTQDEEKDAFYTMEGEINEIKSVIKDIEEKIKDMWESKNQVKAELLKQVYGTSQGGASSSSAVAAAATANENPASSSSSIPATDISHLVRKKRKNDDNDSNVDKKPKTD